MNLNIFVYFHDYVNCFNELFVIRVSNTLPILNWSKISLISDLILLYISLESHISNDIF